MMRRIRQPRQLLSRYLRRWKRNRKPVPPITLSVPVVDGSNPTLVLQKPNNKNFQIIDFYKSCSMAKPRGNSSLLQLLTRRVVTHFQCKNLSHFCFPLKQNRNLNDVIRGVLKNLKDIEVIAEVMTGESLSLLSTGWWRTAWNFY